MNTPPTINPNTTLFTISESNISPVLMIHHLKRDGINCLIDIRYYNINFQQLKEYREFIELLKLNDITYLDFTNEIGEVCSQNLSDKEEYNYKKITSSEKFQIATKRIINGINKNYRIAILDKNGNIWKSARYNIIGRYLSLLGVKVFHLQSNGKRYDHKDLVRRIEEIHIQRNIKQERASQLGQKGELLAAIYLMNNGFRILEKNWNLHKGCEIDIIAYKDNKFHFVEVKTRSSDKYGAPQQAINYKKLKNINKAIHLYKYQNKAFNIEHQIDSIAIVYKNDNDYKLEYYEDIGIRYTKFYN